VKIYIAAAWNDERVIKKYMPPYVLESFMYVQDWLLPLVPKFKGFLFDSGAFTFMRGRRETDLDWEEYLGDISISYRPTRYRIFSNWT